MNTPQSTERAALERGPSDRGADWPADQVSADRSSSERPRPRDAAPANGLLLVDDEPTILVALRRVLAGQPYQIHTADNALEALRVLERERIAVVVSDYLMPDMNGVQFLNLVRARFPEIQRIIVTAKASLDLIQDVINQAQVFRFVNKPWDNQALLFTIEASFEQYRASHENERLRQLTERQNRELRDLNRDLEARIARRTRQLARAKAEWEQTFDAIVDPVAIVSARYEIVRANIAYAQATGVDIREIPRHRCHDILAGRDAPCVGCPLPAAVSGEPPRGVDVAGRAGRVLNVWAYALPNLGETDLPGEVEDTSDVVDVPPVGSAVCHYRDVTDERALGAELQRTQKLASLGLFVGGVAHEINNPVGGVLAHAQLLLEQHRDDPELASALRHIETDALRMKRIIQSLLSFAHGSAVRRTLIDAETLIRDAVAAFDRDYAGKGHVPVRLELHGALPEVAVDGALIHQLIRNLLQNAEHAEPRSEIRVSARSTASALELEVADDGVGISETNLQRIFDPFFTTKGQGRGTGLGLSLCYRIVEQHGGTIEARSRPGEGTTFRITIPHGPGAVPPPVPEPIDP
jgi:two-component system NtrC family sensor kinase